MAGTVTSRHKACMQNDAQITLNSNLNVELKTEPTHLHPSESWALVCICSKKKKEYGLLSPGCLGLPRAFLPSQTRIGRNYIGDPQESLLTPFRYQSK